MSTLVQLRKSPMRRDSPERKRGGGGPPCPSRRERCPPHPPPSSRHRSPPRTKSPIRISSSHRAPRSPTREKEKPKRERSSLSVSRSPSPRTMRIRRAQAERETDKWSEREQHKRARSVSHSPPRTVRVRQAKLERESDKVSERDRGRNNGAEGDRERHRENRVDKEAINDKRKRRSGRERGTDIEVSNDRVERRSARERGVDRDASNDRGEKRPGRERGVDKEAVSDRGDRRSARERGVDVEASNGRSERCLARERGDGREGSSDRGERKSSRDKKDVGFSRSKHDRSMSPHLDCGRSYKHTSRSPSRASRTGGAHDEVINPEEDENRDVDSDAVAIMKAAEEALKAKEKEKPSFELSGKLAEETNRVKGVTLLFTEPSDARKPTTRWRLYVFKGGDALNEPLYIHRQSCYLFGRERRVADIPTDHPSCSKQHAVIQFRQVEKEQPDGMLSKQVRPYIMDLGSTNGTFINDNRIEPQRYYELIEKDTVKFGNSSREYVILHENSA